MAFAARLYTPLTHIFPHYNENAGDSHTLPPHTHKQHICSQYRQTYTPTNICCRSVVCLMRVSREETRSDIFYAHFIWSEPKVSRCPSPPPSVPLAQRSQSFASAHRTFPQLYKTESSLFDSLDVTVFRFTIFRCNGSNLHAASVLSFFCHRGCSEIVRLRRTFYASVIGGRFDLCNMQQI